MMKYLLFFLLCNQLAGHDLNQVLVLPSDDQLFKVLSPINQPCVLIDTHALQSHSIEKSGIDEQNYDVDNIQPPYRIYSEVEFKGCKYGVKYLGAEKKDFDYCIANVEGHRFPQKGDMIEGFKFINEGKGSNNNILSPLKNPDDIVRRDFDFEFPHRAASDIRLLVNDDPGGKASDATLSSFTFLPRKFLPAIKDLNDKELEVTLPTGESFIIDRVSKKILSGVLVEKPMRVLEGKKALPADITYHGEGVLIRVDKNQADPLKVETKAVISKKGFKDCTVNNSEIWNTKIGKIKPEFSDDKVLDKFIMERCQFSIF